MDVVLSISKAATIALPLSHKTSGTTTRVTARVNYDPATKKVALDPYASLVRGTKYVATVTSGAKDRADNALDQNRALAGDQLKTWVFTVRI